jgi:hypothetical protein
MTADDLTPESDAEIRIEMEARVAAWLERKRFQRYARVRVQRFDMSGAVKGTKPARKPIDGATGHAEHGRRMADARRKIA